MLEDVGWHDALAIPSKMVKIRFYDLTKKQNGVKYNIIIIDLIDCHKMH